MRFPVALAVAALAAGATTLPAQSAPPLHWEPAPSVFPAGAQMAIVSGDPTKAGPFILQLSMPAGYRIPPHTHPTDEKVTVLKGTFFVGMGDTYDQKKTRRMAAGSKAVMKAGMAHFVSAEKATVVIVAADGPFVMTYVNPADDPTKTVSSR